MPARMKTERVTLKSFYKTIRPIEFIVDQYEMTHFDGGQSETMDGVDMVWVLIGFNSRFGDRLSQACLLFVFVCH